MTPLVTIVTPTYNKPKHFAECAEAVLAQTFQDWVWWVVFNCWSWPANYDFWAVSADPRIVPIWYVMDEVVRKDFHVPAQIVNWLYPKVQTPYIYFLADDDLIDPEGLRVLIDISLERKEMGLGFSGRESCQPYTTKPRYDAVYGRCEVQSEQSDGSFKHVAWLHPGWGPDEVVAPFQSSVFDIGLGTSIQPDCLIDGGQVLHTKALWDMATSNGWKLNDSPLEEHAGHNDGTLLNRLAEFARFHYVPQRIVTHRRTKLSRWHKPV